LTAADTAAYHQAVEGEKQDLITAVNNEFHNGTDTTYLDAMKQLTALDPAAAAQVKAQNMAEYNSDKAASLAYCPSLPDKIDTTVSSGSDKTYVAQLQQYSQDYANASTPAEKADILAKADQARTLAEDGKGASAGMMGFDYITPIGNVVAAKEAITGTDADGNQLSTTQRVIAGVSALAIGFGGETRSVLSVAESSGADVAENAFKTGATDLAKTEGTALADTASSSQKLLTSDRTGELLLTDQSSTTATVTADTAAVASRQSNMLAEDIGYNVSPESTFMKHDTIGANGTFVTDRQALTDVLGDFSLGSQKLSETQTSALETALGLEPKSLTSGFRITEVNGISDMSPRSPLEGNKYFLGPGKGLPGGGPEIVIDPIPTGRVK